MEATHAVTCFAVTATLVSACFKPFGRPFKVTDKGGDRSMPRVHGKLALTFGLIAASSAASIVWAFVSPYAASEISTIDFFNLLWAAIAMLIAFTAFLVCYELPRGEDMFAVEEDGWLTQGHELSGCRVAALSLSAARLICGSEEIIGSPDGRVHLHLEWLGWVEASITARSGRVMLAQLTPSFEQRRRLVVRLFSSSYGAVADQARLGAALAGLARRGFLGR
jgi:cellulose synthase (UDP-forming)